MSVAPKPIQLIVKLISQGGRDIKEMREISARNGKHNKYLYICRVGSAKDFPMYFELIRVDAPGRHLVLQQDNLVVVYAYAEK